MTTIFAKGDMVTFTPEASKDVGFTLEDRHGHGPFQVAEVRSIPAPTCNCDWAGDGGIWSDVPHYHLCPAHPDNDPRKSAGHPQHVTLSIGKSYPVFSGSLLQHA